MQWLFWLLEFLSAIGPIAALMARQRAAPSPKSLTECISRLDVQNANLTRVMECMARSSNRTAFMEDTQWKLDLLERRLDKLDALHPGEVYVPTPYVNIDDVLKIEGSVTGYDCQGKQHVVQAIRRKLEQVHLINEGKNTLFEWPFARMRGSAPNLSKAPTLMTRKMPKSPVMETHEIICLILRAIERHAEAKN